MRKYCDEGITHTYQHAINLHIGIIGNQQTFSLFLASFALAHTP